MPYCSILFTDSEYITLFETPCILRELEPLKVCIFGQEKLAGRFYKVISQNQPVLRFIHYNGNKGKYCIKYIYFYNIKVTKYMKFTSYKTSLHYYSSKIKSIHVSIFDMFDNKVDLMCMHWVCQFADSSFYNAIQEF